MLYSYFCDLYNICKMSESVTFESQAKLEASALVVVAVMMHLFYSIYPLWVVHRMARERMSPQFQTRSARFWGICLKYYSWICFSYTALIGNVVFALSRARGNDFRTLDFIPEYINEFLPFVLQIFALTHVVVPLLFVVASAFKKPRLTMAAITVYWQLIAFAVTRDAWDRNEAVTYGHQEMLLFVFSYMMLFFSTFFFKTITFVIVDVFWPLRFGQNLFTKFQIIYDFHESFFVQLYLNPN